MPIDIALAALPFEELVIQRSSHFPFALECTLRTCSAEDLMVFKLFAFRPRDLADAESIAIRQRGKLDWDYIRHHLIPLAEVKDEPGILHALDRLRDPR